jgi:hypothetical protein
MKIFVCQLDIWWKFPSRNVCVAHWHVAGNSGKDQTIQHAHIIGCQGSHL